MENLELLNDPDSEIQIALLQGGIVRPGDARELVGIASLFYEPLWIFHRERTIPALIPDFDGRRIALGQPGSGSYEGISRLLEANGLTERSFSTFRLGGEEAADALLSDRVDIAGFITTAQAHYVDRLLRSERRAARLGVEPQHRRLRVLRAEPLGHDRVPHPPARPELRDLLEEVVVAVPEERQPRREVVDVEPGVDRGLQNLSEKMTML